MTIGDNKLINDNQIFDNQYNTNFTGAYQSQQDLNFENTIDISSINSMPLTEHNQQQTTLTDLTANMIKANGTNKMVNSTFADLTTVNMSNYRNEIHTYDEVDDDDSDYEESLNESKKRSARSNGIATRAKRFSTGSSNSSSQLTDNSMSVPTPVTKKGRKPNSASSKAAAKAAEEANVARFGNKYVEKGTKEYDERRNRNNEAVKKCREKLQQKQQEREEKLKQLSDENRKLSNTVDSLTKELNVLKNILLQMNPQNRLPNELEEKIKRLEAMIINQNTKT